MQTQSQGKSDSDCASVWFMRLERAKNLNDFEAAAEAVRELRNLGVHVKFRRPRGKESANAGY